MPYLNEAAQAINTALTAALVDAKYRMNLLPICKPVAREGLESPVVAYGSEENQVMDDRFNLVIYHKVDNITQQNDEDSFGDGYDDATEEAKMEMIVWGRSDMLQLSDVQLYAIITSAMPTELSLNITGVYQQVIDINGGEFDQRKIFNQEFSGLPYESTISPVNNYFGVQYTLLTQYSRECIPDCSTC